MKHINNDPTLTERSVSQFEEIADFLLKHKINLGINTFVEVKLFGLSTSLIRQFYDFLKYSGVVNVKGYSIF